MLDDPNQVNQISEADQVQKKHLLETLGKNCTEIVKNINMNNAYFNIFMMLVLLIEAANVSYVIVLVFLWLFDVQEIINQVKFHQSIQFMDNHFDEYLKMEDYIDWNWSEVFWIYWVFFCIIIGITLIIFLLLVVKVCDFCGGAKSELIEIQGLFWFFLIMSFISANSSYSVLMYTDVLSALDSTKIIEGKSMEEINQNLQTLKDAQDSLLPIIYQVTGGFCAQLLYFLIFRKQISAFVRLIMFEYGEDDEEDQEQQNAQQRNQQNGNNNNLNNLNREQRLPPKKVRMAYKSKMVLEEKEVAPAMNLPQFVSKVSSTYFKFLMNKKDVQHEITQKKQKVKSNNKKERYQLQVQSPSNDAASKNMKSVGRGFSIRSMNRSATATITMNTQGTTNTQADMLHSSRVNTQEKQFGDQNDFEDVFNDGNSGSQDKKDNRGENQLKKNIKALQKQRFTDIPNFMSPKEIHTQKLTFPTAAMGEQMEQDEMIENQYVDKTNIFSPVGNHDQPLNQRRQISMANPNHPQSGASLGKGKDLNMTAPFGVQTKDHINEEEEHDSYFYDRQNKKPHKLDPEINQDDIIHFDDESQNNTKRDADKSNMTQSQQQSVSTCLVCFDATPDSIFNPCGHGGLCYECAIDLMKKTGECYLCRQKIEEILKIDIESRNQGIMKIVTTTKLVKVREKIEITEQEYQYYSAIRRNRRLQQQQQSQSNPPNGNAPQAQAQANQQNGEQQQQQQQQDNILQSELQQQNPPHEIQQLGRSENFQQNPSEPNFENNQNDIFSQQNVDEHNHIANQIQQH